MCRKRDTSKMLPYQQLNILFKTLWFFSHFSKGQYTFSERCKCFSRLTFFTNLSLMRLDLRIEHCIQTDVHNGSKNDLYGTTTILSDPYLPSVECLKLPSLYVDSNNVLYQKWWLVLKYVFVNCREWPSSKLCFTSRQGYIISLLWPPVSSAHSVGHELESIYFSWLG